MGKSKVLHHEVILSVTNRHNYNYNIHRCRRQVLTSPDLLQSKISGTQRVDLKTNEHNLHIKIRRNILRKYSHQRRNHM